ncbi:hypothetical protein ACFSL6_13425 [Paenibacillus thailandensis]|uniref:DUF1257 domain-containing protein n=1 Tax=Paenibacillus thailandensis TaxID=393250 RepID=A0ABW5QZD7_9BACL
MSVEVVLIPLAIALTKEIAEGISKRLESKEQSYMLIPTRMKDEALLKQALEEWSCTLRTAESADHLLFENSNEATFLVHDDGRYVLVVPESADRNAFEEWVDKVESAYNHYLQQRVYNDLLEKAKNQGLLLEKEEILEDNSIQVTYVLKG